MTPAERDRLIEVVGEAMSRPGPERTAYVRAACPGPEALAEAMSLLEAAQNAGEFLGRPTYGERPTAAPGRANGESPGAVIGRYRLLELIGEGGFGRVFMAEQREPVVRRVAVKVIKAGMDTAQVVARFEAERQALALMDHPGIARVFDGGATESGRPYFVMELVRGVPITEFCDRGSMPVPQRLALFREVCGAVQHAHQKGVIHRDLKPGNVLVAESDGRAHPKIIDFGIAKATHGGGRLTDRTLFTEFRQLIGTPEYMSPEQALGAAGGAYGGADVDTRSDIYSLGVLLYELLTGTTPLERESLRAASLADIQKLIGEAETLRPSTRLSTLGTRSEVAAHRRIEPGRLGALLRGDLDWIVLKAAEKDRNRRYETAAALSEDVRRFLEHEPVSASPPSTSYRVRKFVRRNRGPVIAGSLVGAALVLGVIGTSVGLVRSIAERNRASESNRFISSMLLAVTPGVARGEDTALMRRVLDNAAARLDAGEVADPLIEAELRHTIGEAYTKIGEADAAEPMLRRALELRTRMLGDGHPDALSSLAGLGAVYFRQGRLADSEAALRSAVDGLRAALGERHRSTLGVLNTLGVTLEKQSRPADALACFQRAFDGFTALGGPDDRDAIAAEFNLGFALFSLGRHAESEPHMRRALEARRRTLDDDDPDILATLNALAGLMGATARLKEAEAFLVEALDGSRRLYGPDHPNTLVILNNMGMMLLETGRPAEAEPYVREALEALRRRHGSEHPNTLSALANMAGALQSQGRFDEADGLHREAIEGMRRSEAMGPDHARTLIAVVTFAAFLRDRGRLDEAEQLAREAHAGFGRTLGPGHPWTLTGAHTLGSVLRAQGRLDEAEPRLREAAAGRKAALGPAHPRTLSSAAAYGLLLADQGRFADAERELLLAAEAAGVGEGRVPPGAAVLIDALARVYEAWDKAEPGKGYDAKAARWRAQSPAGGPGGG